MLNHGFVISGYDDCVCILKRNYEVIIYLLLYINDIFMANSSTKEIMKLNKTLSEEFKMKDIDEDKKNLGMNIKRNREKSELFLS